MTRPIAHMSEAPWNPPPVIGKVEVIVYAMERGQMELHIQWPDDAPPGETERRNAFIRLVQAELEVAVE